MPPRHPYNLRRATSTPAIEDEDVREHANSDDSLHNSTDVHEELDAKHSSSSSDNDSDHDEDRPASESQPQPPITPRTTPLFRNKESPRSGLTLPPLPRDYDLQRLNFPMDIRYLAQGLPPVHRDRLISEIRLHSAHYASFQDGSAIVDQVRSHPDQNTAHFFLTTWTTTACRLFGLGIHETPTDRQLVECLLRDINQPDLGVDAYDVWATICQSARIPTTVRSNQATKRSAPPSKDPISHPGLAFATLVAIRKALETHHLNIFGPKVADHLKPLSKIATRDYLRALNTVISRPIIGLVARDRREPFSDLCPWTLSDIYQTVQDLADERVSPGLMLTYQLPRNLDAWLGASEPRRHRGSYSKESNEKDNNYSDKGTDESDRSPKGNGRYTHTRKSDKANVKQTANHAPSNINASGSTPASVTAAPSTTFAPATSKPAMHNKANEGNGHQSNRAPMNNGSHGRRNNSKPRESRPIEQETSQSSTISFVPHNPVPAPSSSAQSSAPSVAAEDDNFYGEGLLIHVDENRTTNFCISVTTMTDSGNRFNRFDALADIDYLQDRGVGSPPINICAEEPISGANSYLLVGHLTAQFAFYLDDDAQPRLTPITIGIVRRNPQAMHRLDGLLLSSGFAHRMQIARLSKVGLHRPQPRTDFPVGDPGIFLLPPESPPMARVTDVLSRFDRLKHRDGTVSIPALLDDAAQRLRALEAEPPGAIPKDPPVSPTQNDKRPTTIPLGDPPEPNLESDLALSVGIAAPTSTKGLTLEQRSSKLADQIALSPNNKQLLAARLASSPALVDGSEPVKPMSTYRAIISRDPDRPALDPLPWAFRETPRTRELLRDVINFGTNHFWVKIDPTLAPPGMLNPIHAVVADGKDPRMVVVTQCANAMARNPGNYSFDVISSLKHLLARVADTARAGNKIYILTMDLAKAFYQIEMDDPDRLYCFAFEGEIYQLTRLPMGAQASSFHLAAAICRTFRKFIGLDFDAHADNIIGVFASEEECISRIQDFLQVAEASQVSINIKDFHIHENSAYHFGYEFGLINGVLGIRKSPRHMPELLQPSPPAVLKYGALATHYYRLVWANSFNPKLRDHVDYFAQLLKDFDPAKPQSWASQRVPRKITRQQEFLNAWKAAAEMSSKQLICSIPRSDWPFIIITDASDYWYAGVLAQHPPEDLTKPIHERRLELICSYHGGFTEAQRKWHIALKEILALYKVVQEALPQVRGFLGPLRAYVDNSTTERKLNNPKSHPTPTLCSQASASVLERAVSFLEWNGIIVSRVEGELNIVDILSRTPISASQNGDSSSSTPSTIATAVIPVEQLPAKQQVHIFAEAPQPSNPVLHFPADASPDVPKILKDPKLQRVWFNPPAHPGPTILLNEEIAKISSKNERPKLATHWSDLDQYWLRRAHPFPDVIVIPDSAKDVQRSIIVLAHTAMGMHAGEDATKAFIKRQFTWSTLDSDVKQFIKECIVCAMVKPRLRKPPLGTQRQSFAPFSLIGLDFAEMVPNP